MKYISEEMIRDAVSMRDMIDAVKKAFSMAEKGLIEVPLRTAIRTQNGSLLFMPAYSAELGLAVLKNVNVFPGNAAAGLSTTSAEIILIDASNGYTLAVLDGTFVTQLRTGAASGAAFDLLARKDCRKGALIGTGGQAEAQLEAMLTSRALEEVYIYSRDPARRAAFTERMRDKFSSLKTRFVCADSAQASVEDADLIITVTTSSEPVFDGSLVKKGSTVSCAGTYEPNRHEVDCTLIRRADRIFCDSVDAVLSESGDLLIPLREGIITQNDITGGLGEVINGTVQGRRNDDEIIVFETVGIAAQDLLASAAIWERITG